MRGCHVEARVFTTHIGQKNPHICLFSKYLLSACSVAGKELYTEIQAWHRELRVYRVTPRLTIIKTQDGDRFWNVREHRRESKQIVGIWEQIHRRK